MTELEKAVNYWHSITPTARLEIMNKVGYTGKSITIHYRMCIKHILENKLYEAHQ